MLGKRNLESRAPEVKSSIIGKVARVHVNHQYDLKEVENRTRKLGTRGVSKIYPDRVKNVHIPDTKYVACVQETEAAMYDLAEGPSASQVRLSNIGKQSFFWRLRLGLCL